MRVVSLGVGVGFGGINLRLTPGVFNCLLVLNKKLKSKDKNDKVKIKNKGGNNFRRATFIL